MTIGDKHRKSPTEPVSKLNSILEGTIMAQTINTNVPSLNAQRNLSSSQASLATSLQRLSSGLRINSAKDDAAGLAISERMNAQVKGMNVAIRNANDAISMTQTGEGALVAVSDSLQRMRELAVQSANGTNTSADRANLNAEYKALGSEITRIGSQTKFNGKAILGTSAGGFSFQVGADAGQKLTVSTKAVNTLSGYASLGSITGASTASKALKAIDTMINAVNSQRANFGAANSRMTTAISNLQVSVENTSAARGRIVDADFAAETANLSRTQILQQAGTAMLAQANSLPQNVLTLLR